MQCRITEDCNVNVVVVDDDNTVFLWGRAEYEIENMSQLLCVPPGHEEF
jgi:hypothetical protein